MRTLLRTLYELRHKNQILIITYKYQGSLIDSHLCDKINSRLSCFDDLIPIISSLSNLKELFLINLFWHKNFQNLTHQFFEEFSLNCLQTTQWARTSMKTEASISKDRQTKDLIHLMNSFDIKSLFRIKWKGRWFNG